jgi:hypothetical protein
LEFYPVFYYAKVMSQMEFSRWSHTAQNSHRTIILNIPSCKT